MNKLILATILFGCFFCVPAFAQHGIIVSQVGIMKQLGAFNRTQNLYNRDSSVVPITQSSEYLSFTESGHTLFLMLNHDSTKVIYSDTAAYKRSLKDKNGKAIKLDTVYHYWGTDEAGNLAAVSMTKEGPQGQIMIPDGAISFGTVNGKHRARKEAKGTWSDSVRVDERVRMAMKQSFKGTASAPTGVKCVNWYYEIDNDIYLDKGAKTAEYITSVFNQVAILYANDGMIIHLHDMKIWNTVDPYTGPGTGDYLTQFGTYCLVFPPGDDLGGLIGYKGGGGIAWLNGLILCRYGITQVSGKMFYAGISNSFLNVPSVSWSVDCIAHEQGHQLGSNHSFDCVWNGNNTQIDGTGDRAGYKSGTCPTVPKEVTIAQGGSGIMSYGQLDGTLNFNVGFTPQPAALMRQNIYDCPCLTYCDGTPPPRCDIPAKPPFIGGNVNVIIGSSQVYVVQPVLYATSYTWKLPLDWTGSSTKNTIVCKAGKTGTISVRAEDSCGVSDWANLSVNVGDTSHPPPPLDSCQRVYVRVVQNPKNIAVYDSVCSNCYDTVWINGKFFRAVSSKSFTIPQAPNNTTVNYKAGDLFTVKAYTKAYAKNPLTGKYYTCQIPAIYSFKVK